MIASTDLKNSVRPVTAEQMSLWREPWVEQHAENFMQLPAWISGAWHDFHRYQSGVDPNAGFHGLVATTEDEVCVGGMAWFRQFRHGIHWWKLVGSGPICSDYVQPICQSEWEEPFAFGMADHFDQLIRKSTGFPQALEIEGHTSRCPFWMSLSKALSNQGWLISTVEIDGGWQLDLPPDWGQYEESLQKTQRRKARRAIRMMEEGKIEVQVCRTSEEITEMWPEFVRLHQMRRQQLGQPGCFADSRFERFLKNATLDLARSNAAWFSVVQYQNKPLAILLLFDTHDVTFMYQSGCDCSQMEMEPGHLVNAVTIFQAIKSGQRVFDFLRGDESYKAGWLAQRVPLYRTRLMPPNLAGKGIASLLKLRQSLRTWI
jgi:CelD/BcsL family acetyltransferase involved in cellulose biosynthesis